MNYDFQLKHRGYLKIEGPLSEPDSQELERILLHSLDKCHDLEINIDDITSLSLPCVHIINQARGIAREKDKSLFLITRYQREAMVGWLKNISRIKPEEKQLNT